MTKLSVRNLTKKYGNKFVLDDISFDVEEGELLTLLGSSGCGKTTLLRILIGIELPTAGEIKKGEQDITFAKPKARGMGIVFQNYALFPNMTVRQNVAYALKVRKIGRSEIKARLEQKKKDNPNVKTESLSSLWHKEVNRRVDDVLKLVGLTDQANKKPYKMSGGQQQRVAIARTLVLNPDIILFDEPMASLDADISMTLRNEIKELQKKLGITIIYVTHDQEEAFTMSDRIMVIHDNKIAQLDTPSNIYHHPADDYVKSFVIDQLDKKAGLIQKSTK